MKIKVETLAYNERRYGKPWIARVDFTQSTKGTFLWGDWVGDHRNGTEGLLVIDAEPGDIVATGQKDNRNPRNSSPEYHRVEEDGSLKLLDGVVEAYKLTQ